MGTAQVLLQKKSWKTVTILLDFFHAYSWSVMLDVSELTEYLCIQISHKSQSNIPDTELSELLIQGDWQQLRNDIL